MFRYFFSLHSTHHLLNTKNEPLSIFLRAQREHLHFSHPAFNCCSPFTHPRNRSIHSRSPQRCANCLWRTIPSSFLIFGLLGYQNTISDSFASEPSSRSDVRSCVRSIQKGRIVIFVFCVNTAVVVWTSVVVWMRWRSRVTLSAVPVIRMGSWYKTTKKKKRGSLAMQSWVKGSSLGFLEEISMARLYMVVE